METELRQRLAHVRWIGGGTGAGKSSIVRSLGSAGRAHVYTCDLLEREHAPRLQRDTARWLDPQPEDMEARWVRGSPEALAEGAIEYHRRRFPLIVQDLLALPGGHPRLVEGFGILPGLVAPLLGGPAQALFLVPTPEFWRRAMEARGWPEPGMVRDRERALANRLRRDGLLAESVAREARELGLPVVEVDGSASIADLVASTARQFGLPPADGPAPPRVVVAAADVDELRRVMEALALLGVPATTGRADLPLLEVEGSGLPVNLPAAPRSLSDDEVLAHYGRLCEAAGGRVRARWETKLTITWPGRPSQQRLATCERWLALPASPVRRPGRPLDSLAREPLTDRPLTELDPGRETALWWVAVGRTLGAFILRTL